MGRIRIGATANNTEIGWDGTLSKTSNNSVVKSGEIITDADIAVKPIGATTAPPSYPFRCQIRRSGKIGVCSYYGRWAPSTGDPVILHMDCSIATIVDFSAAGSDGKAYPGYAYENGDVHLIANTSGIDINVFFSFSFIVAQ